MGTMLLPACGPIFTDHQVFTAIAVYAGACLVFGLGSSSVIAMLRHRRWPLWLTPVFALAWGVIPIAAMAVYASF